MSDYIFVFFLGFSAIWITLGLTAIYVVIRMEKKSFEMTKEVVLVPLSILLPFIIALVVGARTL